MKMILMLSFLLISGIAFSQETQEAKQRAIAKEQVVLLKANQKAFENQLEDAKGQEESIKLIIRVYTQQKEYDKVRAYEKDLKQVRFVKSTCVTQIQYCKKAIAELKKTFKI